MGNPLFTLPQSCPNFFLDWNASLKPRLQEGFWNMDIFGPVDEAGGIVNRLSKRRQTGPTYPSPNTSNSAMPPPSTPLQSGEDTGVKTPRPDFTVGFRNSTIVNALISRGLSQVKAEDLLMTLQINGRLYSDPTQNFLNVRFPVLVIEGKAYTTGKTVFEAQNQAAVAGSSMINLQQQFADLIRRGFPESPTSTETPLAFSICTEGPHVEFWVHYASEEDNVRHHHMNIFRTCYGSLQAGLEDLLLDLERLMGWLKEEYLKNAADRLYKLADRAARA